MVINILFRSKNSHIRSNECIYKLSLPLSFCVSVSLSLLFSTMFNGFSFWLNLIKSVRRYYQIMILYLKRMLSLIFIPLSYSLRSVVSHFKRESKGIPSWKKEQKYAETRHGLANVSLTCHCLSFHTWHQLFMIVAFYAIDKMSACASDD